MKVDAFLWEAFLDVNVFLTQARSFRSQGASSVCSLLLPAPALLFLPSSVSSFDVFFTLKFTKLFFFFLFETECHIGLKLTTESRMT